MTTLQRTTLPGTLLPGRKAVVTGAGSGIGLQTAYTLAEVGARVIVLDCVQDLAARSARIICEEFGEGRAMAVKADVSQPEDLGHAFSEIAEQYAGSLDIFVNNAGVNYPCRVEDVLQPGEIAKLDRMYEVNQRGAILCAANAYPLLLKGREPSFIIIGSCASQGSEGQAGYAATKAALRALMGTLAREWGATEGVQAVRVNLIEPDYFEATPLRSEAYSRALAKSRRTTVDKVANEEVVRTKVPLRREGRLVEIADKVVMLALSTYTHGHIDILSGGKTVRL
jgi:NAD(P)-dependent dehydrogenase (short-subunit alcohol dehydrogenase family)